MLPADVAAADDPFLVSGQHLRAPVDALAQFTHTSRLRCLDPATNRNRLYTLTWHRDLWGALTLVQRWGRWPRPSRSLTIPYPDRASARKAIARLLRRRLRHGYIVLECR